MLHKRRFLAVFLSAVMLAACLLGGCSKAVKSEDGESGGDDSFTPYASVNFIDVGYGECTFILFGDGKSMLIDCGRDQTDGEKIIGYLKKFGVEKIDWLVLTHPDGEHVGGAEKVIEEMQVGKAYISKIADDILPLYPYFESAVAALNEKGVDTVKSKCYEYFKGENYAVIFLSPIGGENDPYTEFNLSPNPTAKLANDLSPIIYAEMEGVRLVFTGDASTSQEKAVLDNVKVGFYKLFTANLGFAVDLEGVDFLKTSDGGSNGGTGKDFSNLLKAQNAVAFSGDGRYPESFTTYNLWNANNDYNLWRTDVYGTISVRPDGDGSYTVITEREQND